MTSTSVFFLLWWKNCDSDLFALILINISGSTNWQGGGGGRRNIKRWSKLLSISYVWFQLISLIYMVWWLYTLNIVKIHETTCKSGRHFDSNHQFFSISMLCRSYSSTSWSEESWWKENWGSSSGSPKNPKKSFDRNYSHQHWVSKMIHTWKKSPIGP